MLLESAACSVAYLLTLVTDCVDRCTWISEAKSITHIKIQGMASRERFRGKPEPNGMDEATRQILSARGLRRVNSLCFA
jgi:hypothetical protein